MSRVPCHVSCVIISVSPFTSHMSLWPTATAKDPPPTNSPTLHSRMVCKDQWISLVLGHILKHFLVKTPNSETDVLSLLLCKKLSCCLLFWPRTLVNGNFFYTLWHNSFTDANSHSHGSLPPLCRVGWFKRPPQNLKWKSAKQSWEKYHPQVSQHWRYTFQPEVSCPLESRVSKRGHKTTHHKQTLQIFPAFAI